MAYSISKAGMDMLTKSLAFGKIFISDINIGNN